MTRAIIDDFLAQKKMAVVAFHEECILMFAEPAGFLHQVHRWIWKVMGKLPS